MRNYSFKNVYFSLVGLTTIFIYMIKISEKVDKSNIYNGLINHLSISLSLYIYIYHEDGHKSSYDNVIFAVDDFFDQWDPSRADPMGKKAWTARGTLLENEPHLVTFYESILVSLRTFQSIFENRSIGILTYPINKC